MTTTEFRGWYDRGYLPHFDTDKYPQMLTYRLADSLPRQAVQQILRETDDDPERRARFEKLLDNGHGSCVLKQRGCAEIVIENLNFHDGSLYRLLDWVVMPNHVHALYDRPTVSMDQLVGSWKSYTSNQIKKRLGTFGDGERLWKAGFHDRYVRDEHHLCNMQGYLFFNPVKAGLVDNPFDWPFSSVHDHGEHRDSIERWWRRWKERFWEARQSRK